MRAGDRLGPYGIVAPLGAGGMGEVYRARDTRLGRDVAIKVLRAEVAGDPERVKRFEKEARTVASLSHPNILALFDVGSHESQPYLVTELLEGQTLAERIRAGDLTVAKAVELGIQIAHGLAAAHEHGVVHRDLKPGNVFVTKDGVVKILDFGLARLTHVEAGTWDPTTASTETGLTGAHTVLGTVGYMAPEQVRGQAADHRSDIFSLGCVLYEMLAGERAFRGDTPTDVTAAILKEDPAQLPRNVPAGLDTIIRRCLEKRPEERFSSAHDLALALQAASGGSKTPATVPVRVLRLPMRWLVGAAGVGLLAVAAGLLAWAPWRAAGPALDPKRVVVAPFENRTGDPSLDSFGSLIAEAVTRTAALGGGTVVVPGTPFTVKADGHASAAALRTLARESGAGLVVAGATYAAGDDLRMQAQLFDPVKGSVVVTLEPLTGSRRSASSLLEPLRQQVLGAVACQGDDAMFDVRLIHVPTLDAYLEFRRGYELMGTDVPGAMAHLAHAAALAPDFMVAPGYLSRLGQCEERARVLADLEARVGQLTELEGLWVTMARAEFDRKLAQALQAIRDMEELVGRGTGGRVSYQIRLLRGLGELGLNLPRQAAASLAGIPTSSTPAARRNRLEARRFLGWAYHLQGEYETQLRVTDESLREFPDEQYLYFEKVTALAALGRVDEIDRVVDEALAVKFRAESGFVIMEIASLELRSHGHREAAIRMAEREIARLRTQPATEAAESQNQRSLMAALELAERWAEAKDVAQALLGRTPDDVPLLGEVGWLAARLGDTTQAQQITARLRDRESDCRGKNPQATFQQAKITAHLGRKREAMALLREAVARGQSFATIFDNEPGLEPLWGELEFKEFIRPKG